MTNEELADKLTSIKKSIEDLKWCDDFNIVLSAYLAQAYKNISSAISLLERLYNLKKEVTE